LNGVILFWFSTGLVLVWFFYNHVMGFSLQSSLLIALKQAVNGVFNTLVAMGFSIVIAYRDPRSRELPSLYQTLFVSLALFVLIPAMGYLYFDIQRSLNQQLENYRENTARAGEVSEHSVSLWLSLNRDSINTLAGLVGPPERITQPEMIRIVETMRANNLEFSQMGIISKSSIIRAFSPLIDENGRSAIGVDLSNRDYTTILKSPSHPFIFEVIMGNIGVPGPRLILLAPIITGNTYRGAAFGAVDFSALKHLLQEIVNKRPMAITLVDQKGRVVVSTRDSLKTLDLFTLPRNGSVTPVGDGVGHWIPGQRPGVSSVNSWYSSFYVKEAPLTIGNNWKVVVESSLRPQLEVINRRTSFSLGIVAFLIAVFITLSRQFAAKYSSVVQKLEDATRQLPQRISTGEEIYWPKPITRELAGLTDNFQLMSETIQKHVMELEAMNASLEQRVAERTIQLSKTMHELNIILDNAPIGISKIVDRKQVWVNRKYEELFQYSSEELEFQSTRQLYLSEAAYEKLGREAYPVLVRGGVFEDEHELIQKSGNHIQVRYIGKAIDPSDMSKGILWLLEDVTERKQAEVKLLEAKQFVEQVISSAQEGVIVYDLDLRYQVWNPFMEKMTGMRAEDVLGRHPAELFPFLQKSGLVKQLERVLSGATPELVDYQYTIPTTGMAGWTSNSSAPLRNTKGEIVGIIATVREITERKRMENELRQALEVAEAANVTMNRLLRIIAHEFRSPLGVLSGSTDILDLYWDRLTPEKRFTQHEHIRNSVRQLTDLISSVIAFNRLGTDRSVNLPILIRIGDVCSDIAAGIEETWGAGQKCTVAIAPDCGAALLDERLFRRTVENLLTNAFRYTPADGTISFHVQRDKNRLTLEISDTGIGIPAEDQSLIFDAFYRCRNVECRGGLGLGLSIVRESLLRMGGTITVNSRTGKGTTMRVEIPLVDPVQH